MSDNIVKGINAGGQGDHAGASPNPVLPGTQQAPPVGGAGNASCVSSAPPVYYFVTPPLRCRIVRFLILVFIAVPGGILFHLYCHDWHFIAPNHIPSHQTAKLAVLAIIAQIPAIIILFGVSNELDNVFVLVFPILALDLFAVLAGAAGAPISSWIQTQSTLSSFREFEMFFMAFFTGIQLVMLAEDNLDVSQRFGL